MNVQQLKRINFRDPKISWSLGIATMILMVLSMRIIFGSWLQATVVTVSVAAHELGHLAAFRIFGIQSRIFFVPFLGAATMPDKDLRKQKYYDQSVVLLAGPFVNIVLMVIGLVCMGKIEGDWPKQLAGMNASLAVFNLMPLFGMLDGSKFVKAIYASLDEKGDDKAFIYLSIVTAVTMVVLLVLNKFSLWPAVIFLIFGLESVKDDPREAYSPRAMTKKQAKLLLGAYGLMLVIAFIINIITH